MNIYEKLLAIQTELKAPKSQYNSFGKYYYRNCEDILEAVKPIAAKSKAVVTTTDELVRIGERYYVKALATLTDVENGDCISNTAFAREEEEKKGMDGSQVTGAASSYARKYALNGLFAIDDTKDSDTTNTGDNGQTGSKKRATGETESNNTTAIAQNTRKTAPKTDNTRESVEKLTKTELVTVWGVTSAEETLAWLERKIGYYIKDWTTEEHKTAREFLQAEKNRREAEKSKMRESLQSAAGELPFDMGDE